MYSNGLLHMNEQRYDDRLEPIYNSSLPMYHARPSVNDGRYRRVTREGLGNTCLQHVMIMMMINNVYLSSLCIIIAFNVSYCSRLDVISCFNFSSSFFFIQINNYQGKRRICVFVFSHLIFLP